MKVGDTIWRYNENRRVYAKGENSRPIYREHWTATKITGETSRSWITVHGKAPKSGAHRGWCFTEAQVDDACWADKYRYQISHKLSYDTSTELLRQVAALISWKPKD